ncbi:MAG: endonuclease/exonuclease/phosphatase family protein [Nitrospinales bacterium]
MNKPVVKKNFLIIVFLVIASLSKLYGPEENSVEHHEEVPKTASKQDSEKVSRNIKIVTWNVKDMKSMSDVADRKNDLKRFAESIRPDILILQEISSKAIVEKIKNEMGLVDYSIAISDFIQPDSRDKGPFEVAFISKYPFRKIVEYDTTLDDGPESPNENKIVALSHIGIKEKRPGRGFLWGQIDSLKLTIIGLHLKSSRGKIGHPDKENAEKREIVMASVASTVRKNMESLAGYAHLVAGDFNIGHSDGKKNGTDLKSDCYKNCSGKDGYDETHALLGSGLVDDVKMINLTGEIRDATFPRYPGSPIDNIYVTAPRTDNFSPAQKGNDTFGSDHLPVWTTYKIP